MWKKFRRGPLACVSGGICRGLAIASCATVCGVSSISCVLQPYPATSRFSATESMVTVREPFQKTDLTFDIYFLPKKKTPPLLCGPLV